MTPDQAQALRVAARYLEKLAAAERAHALDEPEALISIFAGIDPIELMLTKNTVAAMAATAENRGGPIRGHTGESSTRASATAGTDGEQQRPTAPSTFRCTPDESGGLAEVVSIERWSVRCS